MTTAFQVFLRERAEQKLEEARAIRLRDIVIMIQKHVSGDAQLCSLSLYKVSFF